ncbi:MAG: hypothetical protein IPL65_22475 [Lewinellaceae bacterium]|nr:hypothetical protein [Lewinellaceae bacterium]
MKTQLHWCTQMLLLLCLLTVGASTLKAQTSPTATIDKATRVIKLNEAATFDFMFSLDIRNLGLTSQQNADEYFSKLTNEMVSYKVDFAAKKATVMLNGRMQPNWKAKEWNTFLKDMPKE